MQINNCTFFPWRDFLNAPASNARAWNTAVADVVTGAEDRACFQQNAFRSITFSPAILGTTQRAHFEELLREALQSGRAAMPLWGRGMTVATGSDAGDDTVYLRTRTTLAAGNFLHLGGDAEEFQVVEISSVNVMSGVATIVIAEVLQFDVIAGAMVWPVIFGQISAQQLRLLSPTISDMEITITEPPGTGELGTSIECPAPEDGDAVALNVCEGKPTLSVSDDVCSGLIELSWTRILYADRYRIYKTKTPGGGYVLVDEVDNLVRTYLVERPALETSDFYMVNSVIGGVESTASNEIEILPITLERVMRAIQERFRIGNGWRWDADDAGNDSDFFINFPNRNNGDDPGHYPVDDFYADETEEQLFGHVQWLAGHFGEFIFEFTGQNGFSPADTFENLLTVPRHTLETLGVPVEITAAAEGLRQLAGCVCQLNNLIVQGATAEGLIRYTSFEELHGYGCSGLKETIQEEWNTVIPYATTSWPAVQSELQLGELGFAGGTGGGFGTVYARLTVDLVYYGQATAVTGYARLRGPFGELAEKIYLDYAPHRLRDDHYHAFAHPPDGAVFLSPFYGLDTDTEDIPWEQDCAPPIDLENYLTAPAGNAGWIMNDFLLLVKKSSKPADGDWHYYP